MRRLWLIFAQTVTVALAILFVTRYALAAIVLLVALRLAIGLGYQPDEIFSVTLP